MSVSKAARSAGKNDVQPSGDGGGNNMDNGNLEFPYPGDRVGRPRQVDGHDPVAHREVLDLRTPVGFVDECTVKKKQGSIARSGIYVGKALPIDGNIIGSQYVSMIDKSELI